MKKSGSGLQEIADQCKVTKKTICKWTKDVDRLDPNADKKKQAIKLKKQKVRIADIAKQLDCAVGTVKVWTKGIKSPLRKNS